MKKTDLLNSEISYEISKMGHFDTIVIGDSGLPIPRDVKRIDLAVSKGVPCFLDVLRAVLEELNVQKATIATEMEAVNPDIYKKTVAMLDNVKIEKVAHSQLKKQTKVSIAIIRSGEASPYSNIILESGVAF